MPFCRSLLTTILLVLTLLSPVLAAGPSTPPAAGAAQTAPLDINAATEAQLKNLPGIGDAYAARIVAGRPYARKDQLQSKNIIPPATYEKIQELIVARQPGK